MLCDYLVQILTARVYRVWGGVVRCYAFKLHVIADGVIGRWGETIAPSQTTALIICR